MTLNPKFDTYLADPKLLEAAASKPEPMPAIPTKSTGGLLRSAGQPRGAQVVEPTCGRRLRDRRDPQKEPADHIRWV